MFARAQQWLQRLPQKLTTYMLPAPVAVVGRWLPQYPPALVLTTALNFARERVLPMDSLTELEQKVVRLQVKDAGLTLNFMLSQGRFTVASAQVQPDVILSADARDYLALALREEDADTLFFSRRLAMEGDTALGLLIKNTLDAIDWEALQPAFVRQSPWA